MSVEPSIFIVTGMHRSGTSLVAALLDSAGVSMGDQQSAPDIYNAKGYYEDLCFVNFHERVLLTRGESKHGWTLKKDIHPTDKEASDAQHIIFKRIQQQRPWGWKDPRAVLFLDFWLENTPNARFVFVYRAPWDVIDSLYRRGDPVFQLNPIFATEIWMHYNRLVLEFYKKHPGKCVLLSLDAIVENPDCILEQINSKFQTSFRAPSSILDTTLLHCNDDSNKPAVLHHAFPQILHLYNEMNRCAQQPAPPRWDKPPIADFPIQSVMQDWAFVRNTEERLRIEVLAAQDNEDKIARGNLVEQEFNGMKSSPFWKLWSMWYNFEKYLSTFKKYLIVIERPIGRDVTDSNVQLMGWCFSTRAASIRDIRARCKTTFFNGNYGLERKDVAGFYPKHSDARHSGFCIPLNLQPGSHSIDIEVLGAGGSWTHLCTHPITVLKRATSPGSSNNNSAP